MKQILQGASSFDKPLCAALHVECFRVFHVTTWKKCSWWKEDSEVLRTLMTSKGFSYIIRVLHLDSINSYSIPIYCVFHRRSRDCGTIIPTWTCTKIGRQQQRDTGEFLITSHHSQNCPALVNSFLWSSFLWQIQAGRTLDWGNWASILWGKMLRFHLIYTKKLNCREKNVLKQKAAFQCWLGS